ncbi:transporter substrate-binding domain-containing protein [Bdellovibrio sp. NC01]|uniref:transporter substrate-binding domain-containing protein n=1 Tax=Bdellovibrio sp. NC01 TaxID=2220073 RepID=UPI00115814D4|nr:transporter substrate-binding domain-containing protein [Bdellovibrio sp. NC01]QDK37187.1 hypothetical protein DOE51_06075 [Bdellovibrio sp. NC01]
MIKKVKILFGFLFLYLSSAAAQTELRTMTIGMPYRITRNQALIEFQNLHADFLRDAGFHVVTKTIPATSTYEILINGDVDAITYDDLGSKEKRDQVVTLSFPTIRTRALVFYESAKKINLKKLKKYKGALTANNVALENKAKEKGLKYITTGSPFQSLQLLLEGKIEYFIAIEEVGLASVAAHPEAKGKIAHSEEPFSEVPIYFSMNKKFKADIPEIEAALKKRLSGNLDAYPTIKNHLNKTAEK